MCNTIDGLNDDIRPAAGLLTGEYEANQMRLRAAQGRLKIEHSIIDGLRPALERLLKDYPEIRSIIPGVIRPVRDAKGPLAIRITVPTTNGWKAIALSAGARQELFVSTALDREKLDEIVRNVLAS
jgi:hypothetical protein